jgi:hypothetical protein
MSVERAQLPILTQLALGFRLNLTPSLLLPEEVRQDQLKFKLIGALLADQMIMVVLLFCHITWSTTTALTPITG